MPLAPPPPPPNRRDPVQFPDQLENFLNWLVASVPEFNRLAVAFNSATSALNRGNHTGTQPINTIAGLVAALDAKSDVGHSQAIDRVTGLQAELDRRSPLTVTDRPGDNPRAFTGAVGGDPLVNGPMGHIVETVSGLGRVARITGSGILARREPVAIGTETHQITARVRRAANPADPNNHAVNLQVAWLNESYGLISTAIAAPASNLTVASGLVELTRTVSAVGGAGVLTPPAGAVYFVPYVLTHGGDGSTWVATLRRSDVLVSALVGETDLTQVIADAQAATQAATDASNSYRGEVVLGYAAVQAYTRPTGVGAILVAWGVSPWDGLGGEYARDATDTTSPHAPPEVLVGADGVRWKRISTGYDQSRLGALEANDVWHASRLETLEAVSYDTILARIAALEEGGGEVADARLDALEAVATAHDGRLDTLEASQSEVFIGSETGENIANASHPINTTGKTLGKLIWDSTNARLLRASGTTATAAWNIVDGSGSVIPGGVVTPPPSTLTWDSITQQANGPLEVGGRTWKFNTALLPHSIRSLSGNPDWLKFHVRDGDMRGGDPPDRHRSELSGSNFPFSAAAGELWVSQWAIPLQQSASWFNASFQLFDTGYNSPSAKLEERGGTGNEINIAGGLDSTRRQTPAWQGPRFQSARRYHRLWRIVQDPQFGELDFWVNGVLIASLRNVPIGQGAVPEAYLKYGIYADDNLEPMGDQEIAFGPMEIATGTNALQSHIASPPAVPAVLSSLYPLGTFGTGTKVVTEGLPAGGSEPGANLFNSLAPPTLESTDGTGVYTYSPTLNRLQLRGTDVSYGARAIWAIPTVDGATYQLYGNLTTTSMNVRVGKTSGAQDVLAMVVHQPGALGRSWVGDGTTHYLMFNKGSSANTATLSDMVLTGPA